MKKSIVIILILALLFIGGFIEKNFIDSTLNSLNELTISLQTSIQETIPDINVAQNLIAYDNLKSFWEDREHTLTLIVNPQHLEEVGSEITKLETSLHYNNTEEATKNVNLILNAIDGLADIAQFSLQNLI